VLLVDGGTLYVGYMFHTILSLQVRVSMHIPGVAIERKNEFPVGEK